MRFLIFFLFVTPAFAQKTFTIKDENRAPISGASIFLMGDKNELVAISDSIGTFPLKLTDNKRYLFHLLGYEDKIYTREELDINSNIILKVTTYELTEIKVAKTKLKRVKIVNKPKNWSFGENNNIKATFERVTPITIGKEGYLRKFSLFARQNMKGEVRIFRFVIFENKNGAPGRSLIDQSVIGVLRGDRMIFNLDGLGLFLNNGDYYIGYETQNNGNFSDYAKKWKGNKGTYLEYPTIFISGKASPSPKAVNRFNLKEWIKMSWEHKEDGKKGFNDIAYEIEMDVNPR